MKSVHRISAATPRVHDQTKSIGQCAVQSSMWNISLECGKAQLVVDVVRTWTKRNKFCRFFFVRCALKQWSRDTVYGVFDGILHTCNAHTVVSDGGLSANVYITAHGYVRQKMLEAIAYKHTLIRSVCARSRARLACLHLQLVHSKPSVESS